MKGLVLKALSRLAGIFAFFSIALIWVPSSPAFSLEGRVKEYTLANGIKILFIERQQSPTISFYIRFRVGAVDENIGMTGTAHLLEHMLFKGTKTLGTKDYAAEEKVLSRMDSINLAIEAEKNKGGKADQEYLRYLTETFKSLQAEHKKYVIKDEIEFIYSQNGGVGFNAMTSMDTTTYVVSLPANRLELWARVESDRLLNPVLREFYSERDVVMEERRRSIESQPERILMENFFAVSFIAHPYSRPIIGWPSDIKSLNKPETEQFFRTYYSPKNTVIAIVGSVKPLEAMPVLKKYFERIPPQVLPPPLPTVEPPQLGERRLEIAADANPQLIIGFHKPNSPHPDDGVFEIMEGLLSSGRTSRFYQRLVEEEKIASEVSAANGYPGERYPNLFTVFAAPRHPHTAAELEKAILQELDRLKNEPVAEEELQKIKNQLQTAFLRQLNSNTKLAYWLSYGQSLFGDWRYLPQRLEAYDRVTPEDISRVARKYLASGNRTVATLVRTTEGDKK